MAVDTGLDIRQYAGGFKMRILDGNTLEPISGFFPLGGTTEFSIKTEFEKTEVEGFDISTYGGNIGVINKPKPAVVSAKGNTLSNDILSICLSADLVESDGFASGSVVDEQHTGFNNQQIILAKRKVSSVVIETPTAGTGTLYTTSGTALPLDSTVIPLIIGSGTVLAGDTVSFAGDTTLYIVKTGVAAPGSITLKEGLKKAIAASATAMTIAATQTLTVTTEYEQCAAPKNHHIEIKDAVLGIGGAPLLVSYSYEASEGSYKWTSGQLPLTVETVGDVQERISGKYGELRIPVATVTASAVINFVTAKDVETNELDISPIIAPDRAQYTFEEYK